MSARHLRRWLAALLAGLALAARPAAAEQITELWRSPFGNPRAIALDPEDSSCWLAAGSSLMHVSRLGLTLAQVNGFRAPRGLSVSPVDRSCWVADTFSNQVVHLDVDGHELWRGGGFNRPIAVAAGDSDGSCWVADWGRGELVHLGSDGTEVACIGGFAWTGPDADWGLFRCLEVNPSDGSCWVADEGNARIVHLSAAGVILWQGSPVSKPRAVSVNRTDGSCWAADPTNGRVVHLAQNGSLIWQRSGLVSAVDVSVNHADGSCLVADFGGVGLLRIAADRTETVLLSGQPRASAVRPDDGWCWVSVRTPLGPVTCALELVLLDADGEVFWRSGGFVDPAGVAVNHSDGSCWVADYAGGTVTRITDHVIALKKAEPSQYLPHGVSVYPLDGSCWVAEEGGGVVHLASGGNEITRDRNLTPNALAVNQAPGDGSCWVCDSGGGVAAADELVHLGRSGDVLSHTGGFSFLNALSVNAGDGSCWAADAEIGALIRFSADGQEQWRGASGAPVAMSVNSFDGSCWVAEADESKGTSSITRLAADGSAVWSSDAFGRVGSIAVNPTDGSCWVSDWETQEVAHLGANGSELARVGGIWRAAVAVNPADGSCWVADRVNGQVIHLGVTPYAGPTFPDVLCYHWCYDEVEACVAAGIVAGYDDGLYHSERQVTRDQMAVYISRALAGGDPNVGPPTGGPTFPDVPANHWAFKYVEYAVENHIVTGYDDGYYRPQNPVDRAQMAVYIARAIVTPTGDEGLQGYLPPSQPTFPDVPAYFWAFLHIEYCAEQEVVKGYPDQLYHPEFIVTRDQMAVYISRAFGLLA